MKVFNFAYKAICFSFVFCLMIFLIIIIANKSICGFSFALVKGNSMYPALKDGNFLVVDQKSKFGIGDIICFNCEDKLVVHRVIRTDGNKIITKGDFNTYEDEQIEQNQIIGKVVFNSSLIGFVFRNLHIILVCCYVIAFFRLKNFKRYDNISI